MTHQEIIDILKNYDSSFTDDYSKWMKLVEEVNKYIPVYLEYNLMPDYTVEPFNYDDFCLIYRNKIDEHLQYNEYITNEAVHAILDDMVRERIIQSLKTNDSHA